MIKVLIRRRIMPGLEEEYDLAARSAMRASINASGFIAGESLCERHHPDRRLLITQWRDLAAWKEWQQGPERERVMQHVLPLLVEDEEITLFEHC
ncbi:Heme-degrading monooxygenase HmoA [Onishia taeanensis]|jgi:heme-degrading monooxygenase HmoA|uniref:Heme-degrading monooxygenase HmoA n=1 Tax=Onishia taeanensis TaxID=284577 RepID=A0A1G7UMP3_9GAMM|nr:antibiotic biosynthesis monooxygenase family protein [Halomonas taeanensis]MAX33184.1 antibiotic biosynthesis monooxygenase [Halomonadaceae bacterium]SDG48875.1 Heme-degrading monooxygenase HmoA [Halomonas taeanensis]